MSTKNIRHKRQLGFSLVEMLVVLAVLGILIAAVIQAVNLAQARSTTEQSKLDQFQEAREAMDQITRDMHQAGYPNARLLTGPVTAISSNNAVGLVKVSPTELWFEGYMGTDPSVGTVDSIHYQLVANGAGCPCLQRSRVPKQNGTAPLLQGTGVVAALPYTAVQNVLNGTNADPIFTAYKADGTALASTDFNDPNIADVTNIRITLKVQGTVPDVQTKQLPQTNLMGTIRVRNCSAAAVGKAMSCSAS